MELYDLVLLLDSTLMLLDPFTTYRTVSVGMISGVRIHVCEMLRFKCLQVQGRC